MKVTIAFLAVLLTAALAHPARYATSAPPGPTPLKTIAHVKSSPLCALLLKSVGPSIAAIVLNDQRFSRANLAFVRAAHDRNGPHLDLDMAVLSQRATQIARNVAQAETLLADPAYVALNDARLNAARASLELVLEQQKQALNVITAVTETYFFNRIAQEGVAVGAMATSGWPKQGSREAAMATQRIAREGIAVGAMATPELPMPPTVGGAGRLFLPTLGTKKDSAVNRLTWFDEQSSYFGAAMAVSGHERTEGPSEERAARQIVHLDASCH